MKNWQHYEKENRAVVLKFKKIDIIIALLFFAVFKIYAIPQTVQQAIKIILIIVVLAYLFLHIPLKKWWNLGAVLSLVYMIPSIQGILSQSITTRVFLDGVLYSICIYASYMVIQFGAQREGIERVISDLYFLTFCYCLISLASILYVGTSANGTEMTYFFGDKFSTGYFFIMLAALYYTVYYEKIQNAFRYRFFYFVLCAVAVGVGMWIYCTTVMLGSIVLFAAVLVPDRLKKYLMSPFFLVGAVIVAGIIVFSMTTIMEIPQIQNFVVNILGKSVGLTGRIYIYSNLLQIIQKKFIWGYGYNSLIVANTIGYGNAQNGLMELMVNYGLVGVITFLWSVYYSISRSNRKDNCYGLYIFIITMVICSLVEVSYNYYFYLILFLLRWIQEKTKEQKVLGGLPYVVSH